MEKELWEKSFSQQVFKHRKIFFLNIYFFSLNISRPSTTTPVRYLIVKEKLAPWFSSTPIRLLILLWTWSVCKKRETGRERKKGDLLSSTFVMIWHYMIQSVITYIRLPLPLTMSRLTFFIYTVIFRRVRQIYLKLFSTLACLLPKRDSFNIFTFIILDTRSGSLSNHYLPSMSSGSISLSRRETSTKDQWNFICLLRASCLSDPHFSPWINYQSESEEKK